MLSVVIPTLNAEATLARSVAALRTAPSIIDEIVVADGGSTDATLALARSLGAVAIETPRGRGRQLSNGVAAARGDWLLLLHADTVLLDDWQGEALRHMSSPRGPESAAAFRFALDDQSVAARRLEAVVAWRCRTLALPYGDQGLLIRRRLLDAIGGVRPLSLMEDVDLVRRIGRERLTLLESRALTSAARYAQGYLRRSARNLCCLALYFAGVPTPVIARLYG